MNESKTAAPTDALIALIKSSLTSEGNQAFGQVVLYTTFGVVRGHISISFGQGLAGKEVNRSPDTSLRLDVIELNDVNVEHYSNHLPTASFDRLYVRLIDIQGFALVGKPA